MSWGFRNDALPIIREKASVAELTIPSPLTGRSSANISLFQIFEKYVQNKNHVGFPSLDICTMY